MTTTDDLAPLLAMLPALAAGHYRQDQRCPTDELLAEANYALALALRRYDPARSDSLRAFCGMFVRGRLRDFTDTWARRSGPAPGDADGGEPRRPGVSRELRPDVAAELADEVRHLLGRCSPRQRDVLLALLDAGDQASAAGVLRVSKQAVTKAMNRVRDMVRGGEQD